MLVDKFWAGSISHFPSHLDHMRRRSYLLFGLFLFSLFSATRWIPAANGDSLSHCERYGGDKIRQHRVSVADFGAVGDGVTLNTKAFQNAMFYLNSFADKGGAELLIPAGRWLTGSFDLISHLTLSLDRDAVILGSMDPVDWPIVDPLPSYGRGRELPGNRHKSLIFGGNLTDVVIAGQNGTIDGQGSKWWKRFRNKTLDYTRPHLIELMNSTEVVVSNLTLLNSPFWTVHPVYCSHVTVQNLTIRAPPNSPNTDGVDPDSSDHVCIEDCYISTGDDVVAIKSGWDEYGISFGRPSTKITIRRLIGETHSSGIAIGSEMSGGISDVRAEDLLFFNTNNGIRIKSSPGRGGYLRNVYVSNVTLLNVTTALRFSGLYGEHPDGHYDPNALPKIERITFKDIKGENITVAGVMQGIQGDAFTDICLYNVNLQVTTSPPWNCSNVKGYSDFVSPRPCDLLEQAICSGQDPTQSSSAEQRVIARPSYMNICTLLINLAALPAAIIRRTWRYRN